MIRALSLLGAAVSAVAAASVQTDRPIIGVLTTPTISSGCITSGGLGSRADGSCFHSLYVKWIESAGGRVVPLLYDSPPAVLDALFDSLNGVLFTGGETNISDLGSQYVRASSRLLRRALAAKRAGVHVPVWGTCMGMQMLSVIVSQEPSVLKLNAFDSESLMLPLELPMPGVAAASRLLRSMPPDVLRWLTTENITVNLHHDGVPPEEFRTNRRLADFFRVVTTNRDRRGRSFVSTMEGRWAPVYGVQWHPERPQFQFSRHAGEEGIDHSFHAIVAMQAMANFLVEEARQNSHRFTSEQEEASHLIYNFYPAGPDGDSYQAYTFPPASAALQYSKKLTWV